MIKILKPGVYMRFVIVCLIKGEALKYHDRWHWSFWLQYYLYEYKP